MLPIPEWRFITMKNAMTDKDIKALLDAAEVKVETSFGKCTTVWVKLENGFVLCESSACVDPANYDEALGRELCMKRIEDRLWELEGYALQKALFERGKG